ncbi:Rpn family recombination-promoting nuclease/putative transposase [Brenneria tiliae]|uniref:Rpn family recombination-promoting nuclease/putative transposase n=1 Tax=Brenneria tiliae TaxID=2914984 RepID=UPI002014A3CB|nr:Rpn family recombination-promoting nuclease/putative transposase [Brenneria tiliae]MCL2896188.1 Rpn family recombination-promoting nuclease/putative transposase [Brenneria tiliae]MCL2900746.1 Rpn family recombination-promoting nuclease/putative transposase [Brenneria tiliae]
MDRMKTHDALFKTYLSNIEVARDFLTIHLPPHIGEICDLSTLRLEATSFTDETLRTRMSDMLYSLQTQQGTTYIYCLIEHQSTPDRLMAFRLLRYCLNAMQSHLEQGNKNLPLVVPLLFYHGSQTPYPYSLRWLDHFDHPSLAERIYGQPFPLIDLTVIPDDEIKTHRKAALLELVQKHIRQRDILELVQDIGLLFSQWAPPPELRKALLVYIIKSGNTRSVPHFTQVLTETLPQHREEIMTIAQQLEQIGFKKGMQQGMEKGIEKGMEKGIKTSTRQIARQLLLKGMDKETVQQITGLTPEEVARLAEKE